MFDPLNQYKDRHGEFTQVFHTPTQLKEFLQKNFKGDWRILYVPMNGSIQAHWRAVGVLAYATGDLLLCIDEIGLLCQGGKFAPDGKNVQPILVKIVHMGRHRNISVVATSQIPTDVALRYRSLCCEMRLFQLDEPAYLEYVAGRTGWETANKLPTLPKYAFVHWKDTGEVVIVQP